MTLAEDDGRSKEDAEEEENKAKAVIAAKTGNLSVSLPKWVGKPLLLKGRLAQNIVRSAHDTFTALCASECLPRS